MECTCIKCHKERTKEFLKSWFIDPSNELLAILHPNYPSYQYACHKCGNKRCPHHQDHKFKCTNSNKPDQMGVLIEEDNNEN
jgi:hypothetical protein